MLVKVQIGVVLTVRIKPWRYSQPPPLRLHLTFDSSYRSNLARAEILSSALDENAVGNMPVRPAQFHFPNAYPWE